MVSDHVFIVPGPPTNARPCGHSGMFLEVVPTQGSRRTDPTNSLAVPHVHPHFDSILDPLPSPRMSDRLSAVIVHFWEAFANF